MKTRIRRRSRRRGAAQSLVPYILGFAATIVVCGLLVVHFIPHPEEAGVPEDTGEILALDASRPFDARDLTASQLEALEQRGSMNVSDGPRGTSVGDTLDKVLSVYPTDYLGEQPEEGQILYCADYFENANGVMTALPPRGLLSEVDGREIVITLLAPLSAYPPGTMGDYQKYAHIYCRYTIDPEAMTVRAIQLGITR